ncbi:hypothetical protein GW796_10425 [archaeon]|nr:hypothetical protein [archaeon]
MKILSSKDVMVRMDNSDWDSLHDVVFDAADMEDSPSRNILEQVIHRIDYCILLDAVKWGFKDTVVRDQIYVFIEYSVKENNSLEAWLKE